jgi:hypothetical protein
VENEIVVNGERYRKVESTPSNRAVVVVDRGWVFAGDVTEKEGRLRLDRGIWVFRWEGVGFDGVLANPKDPKVQLRPLSTVVDIPSGAEIFRAHVPDNWGL